MCSTGKDGYIKDKKIVNGKDNPTIQRTYPTTSIQFK